MKTQLKWLVMVLIVGWSIVGCTDSADVPAPPAPTAAATPEPTAVPEPAVDPAAAVVLEMVRRANAEDYAGAAELVAEDMLAYFIGLPPTGMEIYRGRDAFRTFLQECCTGQHFMWEVEPYRVADGVVYANSQTWMDFTRELGVAPNNWYEIFAVQDGKITLYVSWITEESLMTFKPALREVAPELFEVALPPDETPVSEFTITIVDGTCAASGPLTLQAGTQRVTIDVQEQKGGTYMVQFLNLDAGKDVVDLMAASRRSSIPPWAPVVGVKVMEASRSYELSAAEGLLYVVCYAEPPEHVIGNVGPFVVKE